MMRRTTALVLSMATAALLLDGCTRTPVVPAPPDPRGATGTFTPISDMRGFALEHVAHVRMEAISDPTGLAAAPLLAALPEGIVAEVAKLGIFASVSRQTPGDGTQGAVIVSGHIETVVDPGAHPPLEAPRPMVVAHVVVTEAESGKVLGEAWCTGIALSRDDRDAQLARGMGMAVARWFTEHHTPPAPTSKTAS